MEPNKWSRRELLRNVVFAMPALGLGVLLGRRVASRQDSAEQGSRALDLELEHRYPLWTSGNYATEVIASTLVNQGTAVERNIRWQLRAVGQPGSALISWTVDEFSQPGTSSVSVEAPASPAAGTMLNVVVRRLDPGDAVRLEATFRGVLTLVMHEAHSKETSVNGYLRVWSALPSTPMPG